jgi:hypothetical protein
MSILCEFSVEITNKRKCYIGIRPFVAQCLLQQTTRNTTELFDTARLSAVWITDEVAASFQGKTKTSARKN